MSHDYLNTSDNSRSSEERSQTAVGLAMVAVATLVGLLVIIVMARLGGLSLRGSLAVPAPATMIILLAGFVLFSLTRRRA